MNGVANLLGSTHTGIAVLVGGVVKKTTQTVGATEAGTEAIAQTTGASRNMITHMNTPTKDTIKGTRAAA